MNVLMVTVVVPEEAKVVVVVVVVVMVWVVGLVGLVVDMMTVVKA